MELIPAIDVRGGRTVRLLQGAFDSETVYDASPVDVAQRYFDWGTRTLHLVDLDGAREGERKSPGFLHALASIAPRASARGVRLQSGGGLRTLAGVQSAFDAGISRVVVGSAAVEAADETARWFERFGPERIVLALDVRTDGADPMLVIHGWERVTELVLWDAIERFEGAGLKHVLCTDVSRDGALSGPNLALYRECVERFPDVAFQASGGVASADDLRALARSGVASAISGKALLDERITAEEAKSYLPNA